MQLQILYHNFRREVKIEKISCKLKTAKFFIISRIYWLILAEQISAFLFYCTYIKFLFVEIMFYLNSNIFRMVYKKS